MRAVLYLRAGQLNEDLLASFVDRLAHLAASRGLKVVATFVDRETTDSPQDRPEFLALLDHLGGPGILAVVIPGYDHVSPNPATCLAALKMIWCEGAIIIAMERE